MSARRYMPNVRKPGDGAPIKKARLATRPFEETRADPTQRTVTGAGSGGTTVGCAPESAEPWAAAGRRQPRVPTGWRRGRSGRRARRRTAGQHHHAGADLDALEQIGDVFVQHADAARGDELADRRGLVGAVDAVDGRAEIHRARAERVAGAAGHETRQIGLALDHLGRREPVRPLGLLGDLLHAGPGEAVAADADAVADRAPATEHVIEIGVGRIDDDGAGRLLGGERDFLPAQVRRQLRRPASGLFFRRQRGQQHGLPSAPTGALLRLNGAGDVGGAAPTASGGRNGHVGVRDADRECGCGPGRAADGRYRSPAADRRGGHSGDRRATSPGPWSARRVRCRPGRPSDGRNADHPATSPGRAAAARRTLRVRRLVVFPGHRNPARRGRGVRRRHSRRADRVPVPSNRPNRGGPDSSAGPAASDVPAAPAATAAQSGKIIRIRLIIIVLI